MQSITPHEIVAGLVVTFLALAIIKGYGWINGRIETWNDRQALDSLTKMEKDPTSYADRMVRRQRMMLGVSIYLLCADFVIVHMGWPGMTAVKVMLVIAAGVCGLISGAAGKHSTEGGVIDASKRMRESLQKRGRLPVDTTAQQGK